MAKKIIERITREPETTVDISPEPTPGRIVEEWTDELVGTSVLPLEKVAVFRDEILDVASTWRSPALMAPLTDAELHKGFRKVVVVSDSDIAYQRLYESLPRFSGNPVVSLKAWTGPTPGVAICSVVTGLPDSILNHQSNRRNGNGDQPVQERSIGTR